MLRLPSYIQISQHHVYYFRRSVPPDLRPGLQRRELKVSLRTSDRIQAIRLGRLLTLKSDGIFNRLRNMNNQPHISALQFGVKGVEKSADGTFSIDSLELDPSQPQAEKELLKAFFEQLNQTPPTAVQSTSPVSASTSEESASMTLEKLVETFCTEQGRADSWTPKSTAENHAIYQLLIRILTPDRECASLTQTDANRVKDMLLRLPPGINKSPTYRDRSLNEILSEAPAKTMAISTVNKYLTRYSSLFDWANRHGYVQGNYFNGLTISSKKKSEDNRAIFTRDDLTQLFCGDVFTRNQYKHNYQYWLPLLGLLTGARLNELAQLYVDDIHNESGIVSLDINKNTSDKRLKNVASQRRIPVHSQLIRLGFESFVRQQRSEGATRLFKELKHSRDGYAKNASRWFNGRYKVLCGITHRDKVFHSFRHTATTELKHQDVDEKKVKALLGHFDSSITYGTYGKAYPMTILKNTIELLDFSRELRGVHAYKN